MKAEGTFEVQMKGEPPYHQAEGITLARAAFDKQFAGPLTATSTVAMLAARTAVAGSAAYVALELLVGTLDGREGSFVCTHAGHMVRGESSLSVRIVADSGTGALAGIEGTMEIEITEGKHHYRLDYSLPAG